MGESLFRGADLAKFVATDFKIPETDHFAVEFPPQKSAIALKAGKILQAQEGVSLAAKRATIEEYATMRGLQLVEVIVDEGVSGGKDLSSRPNGSRVVELASKGKIGAVIACKLDRLFRDAADCLNTTKAWDRKDVALHLIDVGGQSIDTSSTMGRFFMTMLAGVAEMERNMICDRTQAAMDHKRSKGERISRFAPFGFQFVGDMLVKDSAEQAIILEIRQFRDNGMSFQAICNELAARGTPTKNGAAIWLPMTIKRILARAA